MVLDFASQESLEIFQISTEDNEEDEDDLKKKKEFKSLSDLVDRTVTPFGRRLVKKWLSSPLVDTNSIKERQCAIEDLLNNFNVVKKFKEQMLKVRDVERLLARVYSYSIISQK